MTMEGGRKREPMIANQHVAGNYNVVFPHSLALSLHLSLSHSHLPVLHAYVLKVNAELRATAK